MTSSTTSKAGKKTNPKPRTAKATPAAGTVRVRAQSAPPATETVTPDTTQKPTAARPRTNSRAARPAPTPPVIKATPANPNPHNSTADIKPEDIHFETLPAHVLATPRALRHVTHPPDGTPVPTIAPAPTEQPTRATPENQPTPTAQPTPQTRPGARQAKDKSSNRKTKRTTTRKTAARPTKPAPSTDTLTTTPQVDTSAAEAAAPDAQEAVQANAVMSSAVPLLSHINTFKHLNTEISRLITTFNPIQFHSAEQDTIGGMSVTQVNESTTWHHQKILNLITERDEQLGALTRLIRQLNPEDLQLLISSGSLTIPPTATTSHLISHITQAVSKATHTYNNLRGLAEREAERLSDSAQERREYLRELTPQVNDPLNFMQRLTQLDTDHETQRRQLDQALETLLVTPITLN